MNANDITEGTMDTKTYRIPACNLDDLAAALEKLNRRAARLDCPTIGYQVESVENEPVLDDDGELVGYKTWHHITVTGETPVIPGWSFEGVVDFSDPAVDGFILRMAPHAEELPREFRASLADRPHRCDHCNTDRYRRETFIVRNADTGEYTLVGRTCLKDYTGHSNPAALASYFEMLNDFAADLGDEDEGFGRWGYEGALTQQLIRFIITVCTVARLEGFLSRTEARERYDHAPTTADNAWKALNPHGELDNRYARQVRAAEEQGDKDLAASIVAWAPQMWVDQDDDQLSDFVHNLRAAYRTDMVSSKTAGLMAALYRCYERHVAQVARQRVEAKLANSTHQGQLKERLDIEVTCYGARFIEGMYGSTQVCKFVDAAGNAYTWFNSGQTEVETGASYNVRGTVKKHSEYKGIAETHLTRCHVTAPKPTPAPKATPVKATTPCPVRKGTTADLVLQALAQGPQTMPQLVAFTGKSDCATRRYTRKLVTAGTVAQDGKTFSLA